VTCVYVGGERECGRSTGQVGKNFDLTETNVGTCIKQAEIDQGERPGLPKGPDSEIY
jgi:hypothetical protein